MKGIKENLAKFSVELICCINVLINMQRVILPILLFFIWVTAASCSPQQGEIGELGPRYEALAWLESNPNPYALAGNRFTSTEDALIFVERLYEYGAVEVLVTGIYDEDWRIEAEGGPYADTLIVRLPP